MEDRILDREFVSGKVTITRRDLESFPCPFCTDNVTDDDMQLLADLVNCNIEDTWGTGYDISDDRVNETFWAELDTEACRIGIPYYEDLPCPDGEDRGKAAPAE